VLSAPVDLPDDSAAAKDEIFTTDDSKVEAPADVMKDIADNTDANRVFIKHAEPITVDNKVIFGYFDLLDEDEKVIDLEKMGNTTPLTVTLDLSGAFADGEMVVIYHDSEAIASAVVTDGKITYTTTHFCEVVVTYNDGKINSGVELEAAISNGGTVELESNVVLAKTIEIPAGVEVTLDLNGYTITSENSNVIRNYGTLTITNGVLDATTAYTVNNAGGNVTIKNVKSVDAGFYNAGTMLVEDCEITNTISGRHGLYNNANATLVINGLVCSTTSQNAIIYNNNGKVTVNDGAFTQIGSSYMLDGSNITINGGTFTDDDGTWAIRGNGHVIKGGTFNFNPNNYVAPGYQVTNNGNGTWTVNA
jgi:hypothetical protein